MVPYDPSRALIVASLSLVVLGAGCTTGPDLEGPRSGEMVAQEVDETPANATVVPYPDVDLEEVRVAVRNASESPNGVGETGFTESDWREFDGSDLGERLAENDEVYVRYRDRVFYVYTQVGRRLPPGQYPRRYGTPLRV